MKVGFIGLGVMGKPMAKNLLKAGYEIYAFDVFEAPVVELAAEGALGCKTIKEVVENSDVIITMLPNSPHVKAVVLEDGGVIHYAKDGALVIDMSSIAPNESQAIAAELRKKSIRMLDAPVSGGDGGAIAGTLSIMVGGDEGDFEEALPLFQVMGSSVVLVGPNGSGVTCKLANNMMVAANLAGGAEALMMAKAAGADVEKVFNAVKNGFGGSNAMTARGQHLLDGDFAPGFRIDLHWKDLNNALETGYKLGTPMPLTSEVQKMFNYLRADGKGGEDHSAVVKYYEKLTGIEVRK